MRERSVRVWVAAVALAAGLGVYWTAPTGYPLRGGGGTPGWSEPARAVAGACVALLAGAVAAGLARVARSQPAGSRGLVVAAWAGWGLLGCVVAVGASLWLMVYALDTRGYHTFMEWVVARGLVAGLAWAGLLLAGIAAWQRSRTPNQALQQTAGA
jgi:hypothetical protein